MRAAILREYGATPELGDFDEPEADGGQVVAEMLAAGLNPVDLRRTSGTFYGGSPPLPSVVGTEGVARLPDGRRVYFDPPVAPYGSFAERTLLEPDTTFAVPDGLDESVAVALGIAGLAGWLAVSWSAKLREGETVLVLAASGIVGQVAVQAARLLGAGRIVAAGRRAGALERARTLGADETLVLTEYEDLAEAFREATGGGPDVTIDPLWGEPGVAAIKAAKRFTRHVALGQSAGAEATLTNADVRGKPMRIVGHTNYAIPLEDRREAYERMAAHAAGGELTVGPVERVPLDDVVSAWKRQAAGPGSKLVVVP
jgi:NADPH:quinone reductase-like Zn-dependent oxidoreductase